MINNTANNDTATLLSMYKNEYSILTADEIYSKVMEKCGNVRVADTFGEGDNTVFVLPEAYSEFVNIVSYGRRSPMNVKEIKLGGYGYIFDNGKGGVNNVVTHFIPVLTTNRSNSHASNLGPDGEANPGIYFLMYQRDEYREFEQVCNTDAYGFEVNPFLKYGPSTFVLEGHTHPDIGVFFSTTDVNIGKKRAASTPVCMFVCDPIRKQMMGCVGKTLEKAKIVIFDRADKVGAKNKGDGTDLCEYVERMLEEIGCMGKIICRKGLGNKVLIKVKMKGDSIKNKISKRVTRHNSRKNNSHKNEVGADEVDAG